MGHFDTIIIASTKFAIQRFLEREKLFQSCQIPYLMFLYNDQPTDKPLLERQKQCINIRKKLSDSNPDEMNSGTFVRSDGTGCKSITSGSCTRGKIVERNIFKEKSGLTI
ncbi:hypothetical protein TNCV_1299001 [Trichonephila clavipes]|nr:hypothetical protein TNCV_1299001 [Trichonephila clavipes]